MLVHSWLQRWVSHSFTSAGRRPVVTQSPPGPVVRAEVPACLEPYLGKPLVQPLLRASGELEAWERARSPAGAGAGAGLALAGGIPARRLEEGATDQASVSPVGG